MGKLSIKQLFGLVNDYVHGRLSDFDTRQMKEAIAENSLLAQRVEEAEKRFYNSSYDAKSRRKMIEAKLSGKMLPKQEAEFDRALEENPLFKEEFDLENQINEGFRQLRYQKFKAEADSWKEELQLTSDDEELKETQRFDQVGMPSPSGIPSQKEKSPAKVRPLRHWLAIAASVLVLVSTFFFLIPYLDSDTSVIAARESFTMPTLSGNRGGTSVDERYDKGVTYFFQKEYENAFLELIEVTQESPNYPEAQLLTGLIGLATPESPELTGLTNLTTLNLSDSMLTFDLTVGTGLDMRNISTLDLQWYTALAYLQDGVKKEGQALLDSIITNVNHPFYEEAKALKKKLE